MKNKVKTPDNATTAQLEELLRKYDKPATSLEAFVKYGIESALRDREAEHLAARFPDSDEDTCRHNCVIEEVLDD